ncbi:MAG: transposase [bacterium F083]|nr:MAG: transposase [bacterium F083]
MTEDIREILSSLLLPEGGDWQVESYKKDDSNECIHVHVRYCKSEVTVAGKTFPIFDFRKERVWRHLDLWQYHTFIVARIPRYRVDGKVISLEVPWADPGEHVTSMFEKKR